MSDTITLGNRSIQIIPNSAGISSFDIKTYFTKNIRLTKISFKASHPDDLLKIRDGSSTGPFIVPYLQDGEVNFDEGLDCEPYILSTDVTLNTPANSVIIFFFK